MDRQIIFSSIETERDRQEKLHPIIKQRKHSDEDIAAVANMIIHNEFLSVLVEEIGEVGSALQGEGNLEEELIHVASTAVRWLEHLK